MTKSILIVDDEFGLADIVSEMLAELGYDVSIAINGRLGLDKLAANKIDLVILDVMMPVMNGPDMLRAMRQDARLRGIPVVMMTAAPEAIPRDHPPLFQATLKKPFSPTQLFTTLQKLLGDE